MTMHESTDETGTLPPRANDAANGWNTAAAAWSEKLRSILERKGFIDEKGHIRKPLNVVGVPPQTSRNWVIGTDAPRSLEEHNGVLSALAMLNTTMPSVITARNELQALFMDLQANLSGAPERAVSHVEKLGPRPEVSRRITGSKESKRANPINDHAAVAPRIHRDEYVGYDELGKVKLLDILSTTENPHEYLSAARALAGTQAGDRDHKLSLSAGPWEHGISLPSREALESMQSHFGELQVYVGDYDRFKHLVINARLDRFIAETQGEDQAKRISKMGTLLSEMPAEYWRAVIDDYLHNDSFKHQESENAIIWQHKLLPICHKGDYVRAMRELLHKTPEDVLSYDGTYKGHRHAGALSQFERQNYGIGGHASDGIVTDMMGYFADAQKAQSNEPAFYDSDKFLALPYTYGQRAHVVHATNDNTTQTGRSR